MISVGAQSCAASYTVATFRSSRVAGNKDFGMLTITPTNPPPPNHCNGLMASKASSPIAMSSNTQL
jgi:hypothetical protein